LAKKSGLCIYIKLRPHPYRVAGYRVAGYRVTGYRVAGYRVAGLQGCRLQGCRVTGLQPWLRHFIGLKPECMDSTVSKNTKNPKKAGLLFFFEANDTGV
jgi:hypothetical protein